MTDRDDDKPTGPTAAAVLANPDLDPDLAAKLQRWFGDGAEPSESEAVGDADDAPVELSPVEKVNALLEHADQELVSRILDHDYTITRDHRAVATRLARKVRDGFEPLVQAKLRVPQLRTEEVPYDIEDAIREDNTPQAILRDLHRVVWDFDPGFRRPMTIPKGTSAPHREALKKAQAVYDNIRQVREMELSHASGSKAFALIQEIIAEGYTKPDPDPREESDG
jgi:hypothetical protein